MKSSADHWNQIFDGTENDQMGWYEAEAAPTLKLMERIPGWESSTVFLPGAGTSVLIEALLAKEARLILNDISSVALNRVKRRLAGRSDGVCWLCQDIAQPIPSSVPSVDIWIDRAVLHFLTDEDSINGYFRNLKSVLKVGGFAAFAEFSTNGAPKCAGLTVHRYSIEELTKRVGPSFKLMATFDYTYVNPNGDPRPYIYVLFEKTSGPEAC